LRASVTDSSVEFVVTSRALSAISRTNVLGNGAGRASNTVSDILSTFSREGSGGAVIAAGSTDGIRTGRAFSARGGTTVSGNSSRGTSSTVVHSTRRESSDGAVQAGSLVRIVTSTTSVARVGTSLGSETISAGLAFRESLSTIRDEGTCGAEFTSQSVDFVCS